MIEYNKNEFWQRLSTYAWDARSKAKLVKPNSTKVGASIISDNGDIFIGCNAQHKFRSHDIHAEIAAICNMFSNSNSLISKILIVSERDFLTPCGSCLDWIMRFSNEKTRVGIQSNLKGKIRVFNLDELIPYYPK